MMLATRPLQQCLHLHEVDSDRVSKSVVRELTPLAKPVDGGWTHSQDLRDLSHGEKLAHGLRHFVVCRWVVQQGSSKILAQICMGLHILAFLVGHTSRICTGLHVLARI